MEKITVSSSVKPTEVDERHRGRRIALLCLELLGMACMLYAILELARYIIVYHQEHPDFYLTWGLYIELTGLAIGLVYWMIVFARVLSRLGRTLENKETGPSAVDVASRHKGA